jgi:hypothetical protein
MVYDGKNKDVVNPNERRQRHLWMQSMSMLQKEKNTAKLGATFFPKIDDYL